MDASDAYYIPKGVRGGFRAILGIGILVVAVALVAMFLAGRTAAVLGLYNIGLRYDAIALIVVRDLSVAMVLLCVSYFVASLFAKWGGSGRIGAAVLLAVSVCSLLISSSSERRLRTQIQNNLDQVRRGIESRELKQEPASTPP